jgi:Rod binding domain-containing protein
MDAIGPLKGMEMSAPQADLTNLARKIANTPADKAREAAEGFEAVFLNQFVDSMFKGMKTDGLFGGGQGEKMWQSFLTQHVADAFAARGGLGIADMVVAQLTQNNSEGSHE